MADETQLIQLTAPPPGAIAILQLEGNVEPLLASLTGQPSWPPGRARLVQFADIDEGLAIRLTEGIAQLMPHGGPRVVQRLTRWLLDRGVHLAGDPDPELVYPEAADRFEALALAALARAASPLAIDLLLEQPRRWRTGASPGPEDLDRSRRLNRLLEPPVVVVAGPANVGKSTLSNALMGRSMSIAADRPGTTRDYTSGRVELAGLVVDWHDTPGLRAKTADPLEQKALEIARGLLDHAHLVIAMTDHTHDWPQIDREPDLYVTNKTDLGRPATTTPEPIPISALHETGLSELVTAVRDRLVPPGDLTHPGPWLFDQRLVE